jgi:hypothetical protein
MNRMQTKPTATAPMDLLGLSRRATGPLPQCESLPRRESLPSRHDDDTDSVLTITDLITKEDDMRHDTFITIKDDTLSNPAGDQSTNWAEVARLLLQHAEAIDATCRANGISSSIAAQVRLLMSPEQAGQERRDGKRALQAAFDARVRRGELENREKAAMADLLMRLQTPLSKIPKEGFQRICTG